MNDISAIECSTMSDDMSSETKLKNHNSNHRSKRKPRVLIDPRSPLVQVWFITAVLSMPIVSGCSPTVKVQSPDKPIEINMNVNISIVFFG